MVISANSDSQKIKKEVDSLQLKLEELRRNYEQYFLGLERLAPQVKRDELQKSIRNLANVYIKNTSIKFKLNQIIARYASLSSHWDKILRQIEDGTYQRDQFKMKLKTADDLDKEKSEQQLAEYRQQLKKLPPDGLTKIVENFIKTKIDNKEKGKSDPAKLRQKLKKQALQIKKKFNCKTVQFKVIVKDGKTQLKAVPKKD